MQAVQRHQAGHAIQTDRFAFLDEVFMHPGRPQSATAILVKFSDPRQKPIVVDLACARLASAPVVITARRHSQAATHQTHKKLIAATLDRLIS